MALPLILCGGSGTQLWPLSRTRFPKQFLALSGKDQNTSLFQCAVEWAISELIASQIPGAMVPRAISIKEASALIAHPALTIGVDTGLTHLAAVLYKPTVEIYCDSPRCKTEGYWSEKISNHGDLQDPPTVTEAFDAYQRPIGKSSQATVNCSDRIKYKAPVVLLGPRTSFGSHHQYQLALTI